MPLPNCTDPTTPTTRRIDQLTHTTQLYPTHWHIRTHFTIFFATPSINYCHQLLHHHQSSITPIPPSTLLTTPLNFKFSNFFRQLLSSLVHSACCTPYTFQFTFTFSLSIGNSLYFQLHDLVSKIPSFLLSLFFVLLLLLYPKIGSIWSIQFWVPHFSSSSLSLYSSMCWLSTKF